MNIIDPVSNLLVSTIATAPDPAASGTSFVVTTDEGALFPDPATDGEYNLIIYPPDVQVTRANSTMVRVTARTTDTFTVTRDTESSNPRDVVVGDKVAMVISAKTMTDIDTALGSIPTDVADLTDGTGVIPTDVSDLSDSTDLIKEDVSELTDTTGLISGKLDKTTNVTAISDTGIADGEIAVFSLSNQDIETSNVTIVTTVGADDTSVPTSAAVATLVNSKLFTWEGSWADSTGYDLYDAVENDGSSYVCISAHTSGASTEPGVGASWTTYWDLFVEGIGGNSLQVDQSGGTSDTYGVLSGSVNSSNTTFTVSLGSYVSGSLRVYLNGQLQTQGTSEDWDETTPASGTFDFNTAPTTGDIVIAIYQFSAAATGNADTVDGSHATAFALAADMPTGDVVGTTDTQTLTNKTIDGDDNTLSDIALESLSCTVAFSAYKSAAQTINDAQFTKIACSTEEFDLGSDYDHATNYRFVAPVAGVYQFNGAVHLQTLADGDRYLATLYKNGSEFKRGADVRGGAANDGGAMVSALMSLAATDYVELYVYYDGTGTKATLTAAQYNYFSGYLVGTT